MSIRKNITSRRRRALAAGFAGCCVACGLAVAVPADAAPTGPVPEVYCVAATKGGLDVAYFGYTNTSPGFNIPVGNDNQLFPVLANQGQPTTFDSGSYPSVFSVTFDPLITPVVDWILNGQTVEVNTGSPQCAPGTTSPASDVTDSSVTLNGVVLHNGTDAEYTFEYGTTTDYGNSTTLTDAGAGYSAEVVQAALTGLDPSTTYYFRLDTTTSYAGGLSATSDGAQQQFTTAATPGPAPTVTQTVTQTPAPGPTVTVTATPAPAPTVTQTVTATPAPAPTVTVTATAPGFTLLTTTLPDGTAGAAYSAQLSASGGTPPYTWRASDDDLPPGLRLNRTTGLISGRPTRPGKYEVEITVTDSASPARESLSEHYTITIAR
jgi:hypothetical protein